MVTEKAQIKSGYGSPRWSGEIYDCALPMTFDTYSACSYGCLYCFSNYQRTIGNSKKNYNHARSVSVDQVKKLFLGQKPKSQFHEWITKRKVIQWGGLSDQFDENERKYGKTLELLRFFREIEYPITFSTKATWWVHDERYAELFWGAKHFNVKFSIISLDEEKVRKIERGVPSTAERLEALGTVAGWNGGGVTLRLRPFIIGMSDPHHTELIDIATDKGASAVSTEFFCLERRNPFAKKYCYPIMAEVLGYDIVNFYAKHSTKSGYLRLNPIIKKKYIEEMRDITHAKGARFYVSDCHFKELSDNDCCCGLDRTWNYSHGHFLSALLIAKEKGTVRWSDISGDTAIFNFPFRNACGFNAGGSERRAKYHDKTMEKYLHYHWNTPNAGNSPYKIFDGVLIPDGHDNNGDIVYRYAGR